MNWYGKLRDAWQLLWYHPPVRPCALKDDDHIAGEVRQAQQKFRSASALLGRAAQENSTRAKEAEESIRKVLEARSNSEKAIGELVAFMTREERDAQARKK
jgi:hypothetical protein